ncbi:hypothetical protein FNF31_00227 [Cafeteria roenbergensis]|uniref:AN1-type domain-containing protein n=1 Tax=Cafeteria roenbergensis TaxID=33653 RepID=A0A5A8DWW9_CAFRO|nr:hypothetical protein FNF28_02639 [Cafeteria roenbergensis]KAA0169067.1 hypothetical protein FNF31_00227 [Cafeteria roenbergensis]
MDVGAHCDFSGCGVLDFLPVTCAMCGGRFCEAHASYVAHACSRADAESAAGVEAAGAAATSSDPRTSHEIFEDVRRRRAAAQAELSRRDTAPASAAAKTLEAASAASAQARAGAARLKLSKGDLLALTPASRLAELDARAKAAVSRAATVRGAKLAGRAAKVAGRSLPPKAQRLALEVVVDASARVPPSEGGSAAAATAEAACCTRDVDVDSTCVVIVDSSLNVGRLVDAASAASGAANCNSRCSEAAMLRIVPCCLSGREARPLPLSAQLKGLMEAGELSQGGLVALVRSGAGAEWRLRV